MAEPPKDLQKELERDLGELEERVDRLRALYEQYFMGYEKLEPSVPRKDVDRRFAMLRKTQIRNTAQRYRFNVVTQKFNTYAMYWTRVCRQIEEGTFKRHVQRAAKRFGPGARRDARDEYSIDVELGDFEVDIDNEEEDMDALLAAANAEAETYVANIDVGDTIPPGARTSPPSHRQPPASRAGRAIPAAPSSTTSFAMTGSRESLDDVDDDDNEKTPPAGTTIPKHAAAAHAAPHHAPRHVALPPGAKPRVLVRRRGEGGTEGPPSTRSMMAAAVAPDGDHSQTHTDRPSSPNTDRPSNPNPGAQRPHQRPPMPSSADRLPPSTSVIRAAAPPASSPNVRVRPAIRPAQGSSPQLSSAAGSVNRLPINAPPDGGHAQGQIATPASPMVPSSVKMPVASPANRLPAPRTPMSPMTPVRHPLIKPQAGPPPSIRAPVATPSVPPPDGPDSEAPRTSRRPPPALPSQHSKKK